MLDAGRPDEVGALLAQAQPVFVALSAKPALDRLERVTPSPGSPVLPMPAG